jgi:hypothetical protein
MCLKWLQLAWRVARDGFALYGASFCGVLPQAFAHPSDETDLGKHTRPVPGPPASDRLGAQSGKTRVGGRM